MSNYVEIVKELMNLPQSLCKACGKCCQIAVYKGCLSYEEVKQIITDEKEDPFVIQSTKEFLSVFEPFTSVEEARLVDDAFVSDIYSRVGKDSKVTFFRCKYLKNSKCSIYDNRPSLCRAYPVVSEKTIFFEGCGYEAQCLENCKKVNGILKFLKDRQNR